MLILGADTSGKNGSIALVEFEHGSPRTREVVPLEGGTFSAQFIPQIVEMLQRQNLTRQDIDGFAVVSGPGSFTGLRVGLAAIKALAEILHKPIAAVSLLEAIARASERTGEVTAALDASRGEVYAADFSISENQAIARDQRVVTLEELAAGRGRELVVTDTKLADFARQHDLRVQQVSYPRADFIAVLGFEKIQSGETVAALDLDANYIRRSDAEIKKATP